MEGDAPVTYSWSFGDGSSAMDESPTHAYDEAGQYTVRLNASNEAGEDARTVTVQVDRALPEISTLWPVSIRGRLKPSRRTSRS